MTLEELKEQLFKLSYELDSYSAGKDYVSLRRSHYKNVQWLHDIGLQEEYYQYFLKRINKDTFFREETQEHDKDN